MMQSPPYEPMAMGSPTSPIMGSPSGGHSAVQSPYLPSYLFGEPASASPAPPARLWSGASPQQVRTPMAGVRPGSHSTPISHHQAANPGRMDPRISRTKEKAGGPPVQSLADSIKGPGQTPDRRVDLESSMNASRHGFFPAGTPLTPVAHTPGDMTVFGTPTGQMQDSSFYAHAKKTPPSPAQIDPFYTQGEDLGPGEDLDETWVTVFGFPPAATSFILQQFSQYGNIVKHVIAPDGNWMHIHYQSKLQAKKALSKNGKIFCNSIMVGVTVCIDKSVLHGENSDPNNTLHKSCYLDANTSLNMSARKNTPIRPLTAAYQAVKSEHEVLQTGNTPQKSSNVVSKAMDYMFGW